jgi:uncharacterized RDD family membrane protein YckC
VSERLDTLLRVETPEGITLPLRAAGVVPRTLAFAVDALIRLALVIVGSMVLGSLGGIGGAFYLVLLFLLEWLYPVAFELSRRGATPGKRVMALRVVMDNGLPPTLAASLLRNLLRVVDFLPLAYATGLLSMLLRRDFKRLGDVVAGTCVVHEGSAAPHTGAPAAEPAEPAVALSRAQQTAIVDWALRTPRLTAARADELALLAAPVLPPGPGSPGQRLLALAQWALGRR